MLLLWAVLALVPAAGAATGPAATASRSTLVVTVDPRMELLGVVQQLALSRLDPSAKPENEIERRFGRLRDHAAVRTYAETYRNIHKQESYGLIATFLTPPPELQWARDPSGLSPDFFTRLGGREAAEAFLSELRDFARVSDFRSYFAGRREEYARYEKAARDELGDYDYLGAVDRYMGRSVASRMTIFLRVSYDAELSYMTPYPYERSHHKNAGPYEISTASRPKRRGRSPHFNLNDPFTHGVMNEYFYAFTDYTLVDYEEQIRAYAPLHASFGGACFSEWMHCARHLIVTALADRLSAQVRRERDGRGPLMGGKLESPAMETYRVRLGRKLEEYEAHRDLYPSLADFYPRLLEAFGPDIRLDPRAEPDASSTAPR